LNQISFRHLGNLCEPLAKAIGANPAVNYQSEAPHGDTPIRLLNEAANRIGAGEIKLAAVVGAEALRTAAGLAALAAKGEDESYECGAQRLDPPRSDLRAGAWPDRAGRCLSDLRERRAVRPMARRWPKRRRKAARSGRG
jgi:acetyl-CoA acetyltransferase